MKVHVLRYGHRPVRDARVTTHCCLVARAFGAKKIIIEGEKDQTIIGSLEQISKNWGNGFELEYSDSWITTVNEHKKAGYKIIHLTMYGLPLEKQLKKIKKNKKILVIIGSQKVEKQVFEKADYNISITSQPHSEIAALAVLLHETLKKQKQQFQNAKLKIKPSAKQKIVKRQRNG